MVQVEGRRHRFTPEAGTDTGADARAWRASFVVPAWAEPRRAGQAAVWVGDAVIPLPAVHGGRAAGPGVRRRHWRAAVPADAPESEVGPEPEALRQPEYAQPEPPPQPESTWAEGSSGRRLPRNVLGDAALGPARRSAPQGDGGRSPRRARAARGGSRSAAQRAGRSRSPSFKRAAAPRPSSKARSASSGPNCDG